jgi:WD40 repeat protein
VLARATFD